MKNLTIQEEIEMFYLKCPNCYEHLIALYHVDNFYGVISNTFTCFKCPGCGSWYSGYEYTLNDEGHIDWFNLF